MRCLRQPWASLFLFTMAAVAWQTATFSALPVTPKHPETDQSSAYA
jgi:hypothetical protein